MLAVNRIKSRIFKSMQDGKNTKLKKVIFVAVAGFISLSALVVILRPHMRPRADWCVMYAPEALSAGESNGIRIAITKDVEAYELTGYLRLKDSHGVPRMLRNAEGWIPVNGDEYTFNWDIPEGTEGGYAFAIFFLSPDGSRKDAVRSIISPFMQIERGDPSGPRLLHRFKPYDLSPRIPVFLKKETNDRAGMTVALISAGIALVLIGFAIFSPDKSGLRHSSLKQAIALWFSAAVVFSVILLDVTDLAFILPDFFRGIFKSHGLYYWRRFLQRPLLAAVTAFTFYFLYRIAFRFSASAGVRLTLSASVLLGIVELASMVSLHDIDTVGSLSIGGLPLLDVLKALIALTAGAGSTFVFREKQKRHAEDYIHSH